MITLTGGSLTLEQMKDVLYRKAKGQCFGKKYGGSTKEPRSS